MTLFTRFPVGLFRAWSYAEPDVRCLVYPAPATPGLPLLLQAFMDRSDLLAWLKDERGRLIWANRLWFSQFGFDERTALDQVPLAP